MTVTTSYPRVPGTPWRRARSETYDQNRERGLCERMDLFWTRRISRSGKITHERPVILADWIGMRTGDRSTLTAWEIATAYAERVVGGPAARALCMLGVYYPNPSELAATRARRWGEDEV